MPLIEIGTGATLHYEDRNPAGDDAPVILIHGMLGTARGHLGHVIDWLSAVWISRYRADIAWLWRIAAKTS